MVFSLKVVHHYRPLKKKLLLFHSDWDTKPFTMPVKNRKPTAQSTMTNLFKKKHGAEARPASNTPLNVLDASGSTKPACTEEGPRNSREE